jgi:hypothetical protein
LIPKHPVWLSKSLKKRSCLPLTECLPLRVTLETQTASTAYVTHRPYKLPERNKIGPGLYQEMLTKFWYRRAPPPLPWRPKTLTTLQENVARRPPNESSQSSMPQSKAYSRSHGVHHPRARKRPPIFESVVWGSCIRSQCITPSGAA